jgi:hypothetical protein
MGNPLNKINLKQLCDFYSIETYVETGTGEGNSLQVALNINSLNNIYTVDIDPDMLIQASNRLGCMDRVTYSCNNSFDFLNKILQNELIDKDNVLFFLDAHFPFADFKKMTYQESIDFYKNQAIPLKDELELIMKYRSNFNDVIILDDLRIYKDGPYEGGNWEDRLLYKLGDESFIYQFFPDRTITEYYTEQGFILITP